VRRADADPEHQALARERRARVAAAIDRLDGRQRTVFMLCHFGDCTPREVSAMTGINESTVRVHLFRAARKLRTLLGGKP
jgi:RNA polymerase sigma-70 factor (ECF subfamily)